MDTSDLLTLADAARVVGVYRQSIQRAVRRGTCRCVRIAGIPLVHRGEAERWAQNRDKMRSLPTDSS